MRKNAFTLIELLAVIVILSIILLIAVPIVLRLIKDSKKSTAKDSLELYGRAIENAVANYFMKNPEEDEVLMEELQEGNYIQYKGTPITCEEVQIYKDNIYLASCKMKEDYIDATYGKHVSEETMLKKNYIGYYADVDADGTVDGVIYADLAHSKSGKWGPYNNNEYIDRGEYSYEAKDNLKEYTISENKYTEGKFGEKEIITLKPGSTGNSRFYVMALTDFTEGSIPGSNAGKYYWYKNAYDTSTSTGRMPSTVKDTSKDFGTGYDNTGTMIRIWNNNGNEEGWTTGATQDTDHYDIFEHIQNEYRKGWYIPSRGEWLAFADYLASRKSNMLTADQQDLNLNWDDSGNYDDIYGLLPYYWSSSQYNDYVAGGIGFDHGYVYGTTVTSARYVRLSVTF